MWKINTSVNNCKECKKDCLDDLVKSSDEIETNNEKKYYNIEHLKKEILMILIQKTSNREQSNKADSDLTLQNDQHNATQRSVNIKTD